MMIFLTILGVGLTIAMLRDMFHTLFASSERGALSNGVARFVWRAFRYASRQQPDRLSIAGPISMMLIILLWTVGLVVGWACILWPHLPEEFLLATGMTADRNAGFFDAVYLSLVTLGTLGYGDITPQATWLRIAAPLEALIGFSLFTAAISWIMSTYPALARRHHLGREVSVLQRSEQRSGIAIDDVGAETCSTMLRSLTSQVIAVRNDFVQFPITYYFRSRDRASALDVVLPALAAFAREGSSHDAPVVRLSATQLLEALGDLTSYLAITWLDCDDANMDDVLDAYAADHLHRIDGPLHSRG